jgi:hypothetical protein
MNKNNTGNRFEIIELVFYILIAFVSVYFIPAIISKVVFLGSLIIVWKSKRDYFWFAFYFILLNQPGGFFSGGLASDEHRLPIYSLGGGVSFTITELYLLVVFAKIYFDKGFKNRRPYVFFKKELTFIFILFISLVLISPILGMSATSMRETYKTAIHLTLFRSLFYVLPDEKSFASFLKLLFPFVALAIAMQIYGLMIGMVPVEVLKPGSVLNLYGDEDTKFRRPIEMAMLLLVTYSGAMYFKSFSNTYFKTTYLDIVLGASFLSILITGTRTWFVAFVIGFLYYTLFVKKIKLSKSIFSFIFATAIIFVLVTNISTLGNQLTNSWDRLSTIGALADGDLTMEGTAGRYTDYTPLLVEAFMNSTIIVGAAFSNFYYGNENIHVGYHNNLLNIGVIGVLVFLIFFAKVFITVYNSKSVFFKASIMPIILLLIINTGVQTIGFGVIHTTFFMTQAIALVFLSVGYNQSNNLNTI